jgi:hypothetical protein
MLIISLIHCAIFYQIYVFGSHWGKNLFSIKKFMYDLFRKAKRDIIKKGELPRLKCFHNGIILIVICFQSKCINNYYKLNKSQHTLQY